MLLDTYGLVYRAFFALPPLTTTRGMPINAAYGFTMMLNKIVNDEKPTHIIAAFDKGLPAHRVALYQQYKAQRDQMPDDLRSQFALVRRILAVNKIPVIEIEGEEADDVIATLARQAEDAGEETVVVTGDTDLMQVVDDRTTLLMTRRGITELGRYDLAAVRERYEGLNPAQLPDYRGLKGDPSDNLPGIPGVGEKTAIKLIKAAGSLDALVADPALAGTPKLQKLVEEYGKQAQICRDVSVANKNLPLTLDWEDAKYTPPSNEDLYRLYSDLEFKTLLNKLDVPLEMPLIETQERLKGRYRSYIAATDPPEFAELARDLEAFEQAERLAFAVKLDGEIGISAQTGTGLSFLAGALAHDPVKGAFEKVWLGGQRLAAHDVKSVLRVLHDRGFAPRVFVDDSMVAAHLLNPSRTFADIEDASQEVLALSAGDDVAAHADAVLRIAAKAREELHAREQLELYETVEVPLAPVLARMEWTGVLVDPAQLQTLAAEVNGAIERLQKAIYDFAGEEFNIGSPAQLGNILFGKLCIPGGKKTKTGWATGVEVLAGLARDYPICAKVLEYREVTKLKNTYIDVIPELADKKDGRLRTIFNQTATATGRLSSTNPNLQNIPVRGELGRRIRRAFVAPPDDYVLLAADYSQIELRLMAHLSGDEAMRRAFHEGQDIHDFTARQIFGVAAGQTADGNQRRIAKSVNFGLLYGMSDFGLAQRLEISRAEAKEMTAAYFARFPSVRAYIDGVIEQGRANGFVTTILGRRRYMPALRSSNYMLRSAAEREATNAPLQGSAADIMKLAMVRIDGGLGREGFDARMLLQIHDELIFEVRKAQLQQVAAFVRSEMENVVKLSVPLAVTVKVGENWYDVEETHDF
ncbi:MAG TPA: DNA polymerase I [Candidatus Baltobacteraceae bacterium]|jgi:DNA polymerase-1|nr:DNA polymerase I [Candidatus Baltobacteraceae bacterium]